MIAKGKEVTDRQREKSVKSYRLIYEGIQTLIRKATHISIL